MKILVSGGAGYIGSFAVDALIKRGDEVVVIDSLERGHKDAVNSKAKLYEGNLLDTSFLAKVFEENKFDGVINFAGFISMGESMQNPEIYFQNNVFTALNLLEQMAKSKTDNFIFSSSAGVYGNPTKIPIPEDHQTNPTNPYGESKLMVEKIMRWYNQIHGINCIALRYFNASGASLDGSLGERHIPESHIIPNIINAILKGESFKIFGTDYKTKDGTCVRDYIHVLDLIDAHLLALEKLKTGMHIYNIGTGNGYSNKEIIDMVKKVSGKELAVEEHERRAGDADELVADATRIKNDLGFSPKHSDLETIVSSAWQWHSKLKTTE